MRTKPVYWTLTLSLPLLVGTTSGQTVRHGEFGPGSEVPEASAALCEMLPENAPLIDGLTTGWAVSRSESDGVRLVFSSLALACADDADTSLGEIATKECISGWSFSLRLPEELLQPGTYELGEYQVEFRSEETSVDNGPGCGSECSVAGSGTGMNPSANGPKATLELFSVTDECITGKLTGLSTGQIEPPPADLNGGFHAVRCDD